jgi:O-Antigen ligase.
MYFTGQKTGMIPIFILIAFIFYDQIYPIKPYKTFLIFSSIIALIYFTPENIFNFKIENIFNYINQRFSRIDSITSRLELKVMALEIFSSNPIFGGGQDGFQIKYGTNNPHDWNFQVLSETGLIGLFFYLIIMVYIAKIIQNNYGNKFLLLYMLIFIVVSSAGGSNFNAHPFWVTASFLASYNIYIQNKQLL